MQLAELQSTFGTSLKRSIPMVEKICGRPRGRGKRQTENIPAAASQLQSRKPGPSKRKSLYSQI